MFWREKENNGNHGSRNGRDRERGGERGCGKRQGRGVNDGKGRPNRGRRNVSSVQTQIDELTKLITAQTQTIASLASNNDIGNTNTNNSVLRRPGT